MSESEFHLASLRDPRLSAHAVSTTAAWLWAPDGTRVVWTNAAGAAAFGSADTAELAARRFDARDPAAAQIARLAGVLREGSAPRLDRLRGFGAGMGRMLTCTCSRISLPDHGHGILDAILVVATERAGPALPLAERVRRLFAVIDAPIAVFSRDGALLHAAPASLERLSGATTLAALGATALADEALAAGHAAGHAGSAQISIDRIGSGADAILTVMFPRMPNRSELADGDTGGTASATETSSSPAIPTNGTDVSTAPDAAAAAPTETAPSDTNIETAPALPPTPPERRHPLRFVWQIDADGRFTLNSDEFTTLIGPRTAAALGRPWAEVAADLGLDPQERVTRAVMSRDTWSGVTVAWPVDGSPEPLMVELSGLPVFDRERQFRGYRGFGVCRDIARLTNLVAMRHAEATSPSDDDAGAHRTVDASPDAPPIETPASVEDGASEPVTPSADADASGGSTPPVQPQRAEPPVLTVVPAAKNVVPFRAAGSDSKIPSLSPVERKAFRELAKQLTARLADPDAPPPPLAPDEGDDDAAAFAAEATDETPAVQAPADVGRTDEAPADQPTADEPRADAAPAGTASADEASTDTAAADAPREPDTPSPAPTPDEPLAATFEATPPVSPAAQADATPEAAAHEERVDPIHVDAAPALQPVERPADERPVLDRLPFGVLVYRLDTLLYANPAFLRWAGHADLHALTEDGGLDSLFIEPGAEAGDIGGAGQRVTLSARRSGEAGIDSRLLTTAWSGEPALMLVLGAGATATPVSAASVTPSVPAEPAVMLSAAAFGGHDQASDAARDAELKVAEAALRLAQDEIGELRAILDTATDGVIVIDRSGKVLASNASADALFGYDSRELVGRELRDLFAPESERAALDYLDGLMRNGVASVLNDGREVIGHVRGGGLIPLFMTMGRVGEDGQKLCAVFRDITQWKKAEEELINARRQAEKASSAKSDFLAKISHEIRTPLNAIIGFSEVMMGERFGPIGNERYREYLKDIHASGEHLVSLINDLLDLSKIEAGKLDLTFSNVNLNDLTQQCVAIMQPQANRERIIIRTSLSPKLPQIVADARSVRQIVLNLLSNSIKFNAAGGQVIVSTALTDVGEVVLRVRDTGVGMSEKDIQTALEPFRQLATSGRRGSGGTGLGLPLTKALAEANRASFSIKSAVESGTLVEVVFPPTRVLAE